jgi:hypothetical protein
MTNSKKTNSQTDSKPRMLRDIQWMAGAAGAEAPAHTMETPEKDDVKQEDTQ